MSELTPPPFDGLCPYDDTAEGHGPCPHIQRRSPSPPLPIITGDERRTLAAELAARCSVFPAPLSIYTERSEEMDPDVVQGAYVQLLAIMNLAVRAFGTPVLPPS